MAPTSTGPRAWLLRHDPGLAVVRRAARVTLVACVAFYLCRYALGNVTMAPYALFGVVAMGALSQIPGSPAERARTLLAVLPVGWVLVTLGTLLSVSTATAVAGHVRARVRGQPTRGSAARAWSAWPRAPSCCTSSRASRRSTRARSGWRLAGLTLGVLLLAAAEVTLWPDPTPPPYTAKLGDAVGRARAAAWTRWPTCGRGGPTRRSGSRPRCPRRPTPPRRCGPRGCHRGSGPPRRGGATGRSRPPRAPPGCCWAARWTCRSSTTTAPSRCRPPPRCCARRPRAPPPPRPGCAAPSRRCPTPTGSRPRWPSSAPPARPSRPTACPRSGCGWASLALSLGEWTKSMVAADPGRGGRARPAGRHAAVGPAGPALVRLPQHPVAVVAPAARAPHAALGLLPGRAAAGAGARGGPAAGRRVRPVARLLGAAHRPHAPAHLGRRDPLGAAPCAGRHGRGRASSPRRCWWSACPRRCTRWCCRW